MARSKSEIRQYYKTGVPAMPSRGTKSYDDYRKELTTYARKLAKQADQRLVRLEQYSQQEHYKGVKNYAYASAEKDIKSSSLSWGDAGLDKPRYNRDMPTDIKSLQSKINSMRKFLESPTSTKAGITNVYKERAKTVNEKYGTNFTWQELANYYESDESKQLDSKYGSKTLVKALGSIKRLGQKKNESDKEYQDRINNVIESNIKVSNDDIVNTVARQLLKQGYNAEDLFH